LIWSSKGGSNDVENIISQVFCVRQAKNKKKWIPLKKEEKDVNFPLNSRKTVIFSSQCRNDLLTD